MQRNFLPLAATFLCGCLGVTPATSLETQRAAFRDAYAAAERGDLQPAETHESLLKEYVLWPDLRAVWLRSTFDTEDPAVIREFFEEHGQLRPARSLRYQYALHLAANRNFTDFLDLYREHYQELGIAKLDCLAAQAGIVGGQPNVSGGGADHGNSDAAWVDEVRRLWLVGRSQVDECDPVFDHARSYELLDESLYAQRFELAVAAKEFSLARYLARSLDQSHLDEANAWIAARDRPREFLDTRPERDDAKWRRQSIYALERLAYGDAEQAAGYWQRLRDRHAFSLPQAAGISRHIALWMARQHRPTAFEMLRDLPEDAVDAEVRRWRVRAALRQQAWADVIAAIEEMPHELRLQEEWRYWLAVARNELGEVDLAAATFAELAGERSYYGFLAADELGLEYAWSHAALTPDEDVLAKLVEDPSLTRARELYYVGLDSQGRSEWDEAVSSLQPDEKAQAAILAHSWNWHSRAIATAAAVDRYDDLEIRYPLPYRAQFEEYSASASIPHSWAYGVARSESLFMPDVRSIAGAVGVMQLMPETGRRTAAEINLPFSGTGTLTDPDSNIRLGTVYLGKMLQRFSDSRVLATAAYNAGPLRVERWLPSGDRLDARIWVENIPFNETRSYVRRVLVTDAIFHWRLTGQTRRLSEDLNGIDPARLARQAAAAERKEADDS